MYTLEYLELKIFSCKKDLTAINCIMFTTRSKVYFDNSVLSLLATGN